MKRTQPILDDLIIGGGLAGLTAALTLARRCHTVAVFASGDYRNGATRCIHTVLTWDHQYPIDFHDAARENITLGYVTTALEDVAIEKLQRAGDVYFKAIDKHGKLLVSEKVPLATEVMDVHPDIGSYGDYQVSGMQRALHYRFIS